MSDSVQGFTLQPVTSTAKDTQDDTILSLLIKTDISSSCVITLGTIQIHRQIKTQDSEPSTYR